MKVALDHRNVSDRIVEAHHVIVTSRHVQEEVGHEIATVVMTATDEKETENEAGHENVNEATATDIEEADQKIEDVEAEVVNALEDES